MTQRDGTGPKTVVGLGGDALVVVVRVWIAAAMLIAPVLVFLGGAVWCALVISWFAHAVVAAARAVGP